MSLIFLFNVEFIISCWYDRICWLLQLFLFSHLFICVCVKVMHLDISTSPVGYTWKLPCTSVSRLGKSCPRNTQHCQFLCIFPWYVIHSKQIHICFLFKRHFISTHICGQLFRLVSTVGGKKSIVYKCLGLKPDC